VLVTGFDDIRITARITPRTRPSTMASTEMYSVCQTPDRIVPSVR
jgi:hypothetical protein